MNNLKIYIALWGCLLTLYSCNEKNLIEYENNPGLQFYWGNIPGQEPQKDSMNCSFFIQPDDKILDTLWLKITTMGFPEKRNRTIKLMQKKEPGDNTAITGTHYVPFDAVELKELMVIKSGEVEANIPIVLKRDPSLKEKEYRMTIMIMPNENFVNGITAYQTFIVKITDTASQPNKWSKWEWYFGKWGPEKMKFLIKYVGIDFEKDYPSYMIEYYATFANEKLAEYKANPNNKPLQETDGTPVEFK